MAAWGGRLNALLFLPAERCAVACWESIASGSVDQRHCTNTLDLVKVNVGSHVPAYPYVILFVTYAAAAGCQGTPQGTWIYFNS